MKIHQLEFRLLKGTNCSWARAARRIINCYRWIVIFCFPSFCCRLCCYWYCCRCYCWWCPILDNKTTTKRSSFSLYSRLLSVNSCADDRWTRTIYLLASCPWDILSYLMPSAASHATTLLYYHIYVYIYKRVGRKGTDKRVDSYHYRSCARI